MSLSTTIQDNVKRYLPCTHYVINPGPILQVRAEGWNTVCKTTFCVATIIHSMAPILTLLVLDSCYFVLTTIQGDIQDNPRAANAAPQQAGSVLLLEGMSQNDNYFERSSEEDGRSVARSGSRTPYTDLASIPPSYVSSRNTSGRSTPTLESRETFTRIETYTIEHEETLSDRSETDDIIPMARTISSQPGQIIETSSQNSRSLPVARDIDDLASAHSFDRDYDLLSSASEYNRRIQNDRARRINEIGRVRISGSGQSLTSRLWTILFGP